MTPDPSAAPSGAEKPEQRGVYEKFSRIERTDGTHVEGGKHHGCRYFVLDLDHDEYARAAMRAYAAACREKYPALAEDIDDMFRAWPCGCRSIDECERLLHPREQCMGDVLARKMQEAKDDG